MRVFVWLLVARSTEKITFKLIPSTQIIELTEKRNNTVCIRIGITHDYQKDWNGFYLQK